MNASEKQVEAYAESQEQWKRDHGEAMACRDLEDLVAIGLFLYPVIKNCEKGIRGEVFRNEKVRDPLLGKRILDSWHATTESIIPAVARFTAMGYDIANAEQLTDAMKDIAEMLANWQAPEPAKCPAMHTWYLTEKDLEKLQEIRKRPIGSPGKLTVEMAEKARKMRETT